MTVLIDDKFSYSNSDILPVVILQENTQCANSQRSENFPIPNSQRSENFPGQRSENFPVSTTQKSEMFPMPKRRGSMRLEAMGFTVKSPSREVPIEMEVNRQQESLEIHEIEIDDSLSPQ